MADSSLLPWQDADWMQQAHEWIRAEAALRAIQITGDIEQPHLYPWSTVLVVPSTRGRLFFKATAPETIFEAVLTQKLADWLPDCMPELVALEPARGWMLMRDGGEQLRHSVRASQDIRAWAPVIVRYADVQIELARRVDEILTLGVPDHRLAALPALFVELLADETSLMIGREKGLTSSEFLQLQSLTPRFGQICETLATFGIPESLNNGDFHDGNVLLRNGRITFFDWGDATVTHPFVSLRTFFVSIEISLQLDEYSLTPDMEALLHLYLERWEKFSSAQELAAAYRYSRPVAAIVKALLWHNTVSKLKGNAKDEYAWIVPELFREFMLYEKMLSD